MILPWTAANLVPRFLVPGCKRCGGEPLYPGAVGESHSIPEQWGRATESRAVGESHCILGCGGEPLYPGAVGENHCISGCGGEPLYPGAVEESHCISELRSLVEAPWDPTSAPYRSRLLWSPESTLGSRSR